MMNREECSKAINDICTRHDCLTMNQQQALGNMLYGYFETGSEEYRGAVDFLWMAFEIDLNTKFELLDIMG